jgi:hypothetical protein
MELKKACTVGKKKVPWWRAVGQGEGGRVNGQTGGRKTDGTRELVRVGQTEWVNAEARKRERADGSWEVDVRENFGGGRIGGEVEDLRLRLRMREGKMEWREGRFMVEEVWV